MKFSLLTLALAALTTSALAETERQHGAHEHGAARLMVSSEGRDLVIELDSPAFNIFGFEHRPSTDAHWEVVNQAVSVLKQGSDLFALTKAAGCEFEDSHIDSWLLEGKESADEHHGEHSDEHHEDHADEHHEDHADEHHDEHADEHHAEEEGKDGHSDVVVEWHFECADLNRLSGIEVKLFDFFPNLDDVDAQYITNAGQGAAELSPRNPALSF